MNNFSKILSSKLPDGTQEKILIIFLLVALCHLVKVMINACSHQCFYKHGQGLKILFLHDIYTYQNIYYD
uniref:Unkown protein n=1 Tax=Riptortus pedestris TaxID=329032 RepID=R4WKM8_RIPPE|nr:unkown protein [Riptortus pedestris]